MQARLLHSLRTPPCHLFRRFSTQSTAVPSFAFDIDGVLLHGRTPLPPARAALDYLFDPSRLQWRYPITFITNGGGHTEAYRAQLLSSLFDLPIQPNQIVLAHTPMRSLAPKYNAHPGTVVTVGPPSTADAARHYGFHRVLAAERLARAYPNATPFTAMDHLDPTTTEEQHLASLPVSAVFVMADSRDWGRDIQLLVDILASDGGAARGRHLEQVVDLYFSNPDVLFPSDYGTPRLAGGTFRVALEAVFEKVTGRKLSCVQWGKPNDANFDIAEEVLRKEAERLGVGEIGPVYMVGDNPKSDVRGANQRGGGWVSVLVKTGNFKGEGNDTQDPAQIVCENVYDAVRLAVVEANGEQQLERRA